MSQAAWKKKVAKAREGKPTEVIQVLPLDPENEMALQAADRAVVAAENDARTVWFTANSDRADRHLANDEREAFVAATEGVIEAKAARQAAQDAADETTIYLLLRSIPTDAFEQLQAPFLTDGNRIDMNAFGPALLAACHVHLEPDGYDAEGNRKWTEHEGIEDADEAREFLATPGMTVGDKTALIQMAYTVNTQTKVGFADLGKGSRLTQV